MRRRSRGAQWDAAKHCRKLVKRGQWATGPLAQTGRVCARRAPAYGEGHAAPRARNGCVLLHGFTGCAQKAFRKQGRGGLKGRVWRNSKAHGPLCAKTVWVRRWECASAALRQSETGRDRCHAAPHRLPVQTCRSGVSKGSRGAKGHAQVKFDPSGVPRGARFKATGINWEQAVVGAAAQGHFCAQRSRAISARHTHCAGRGHRTHACMRDSSALSAAPAAGAGPWSRTA